jgi:hypothetical protein
LAVPGRHRTSAAADVRIYCADLGEPGTGKHGARDMDFNAPQEFKAPISQ